MQLFNGACALVVLCAVVAVVSPAESAPSGSPGRTRITNKNAGGALRGAARAEWASLKGRARRTAAKQLKKLHITEADADYVHFDKSGQIYMADGFSGAEQGEERQGGRNRRSISDATPTSFSSSGKIIFRSVHTCIVKPTFMSASVCVWLVRWPS